MQAVTYSDSAPNLGDLFDEMNEMSSPHELLTYLHEIPWKDIFTLYLPLNLSNRDADVANASTEIMSIVSRESNTYNESIQGRRAASLASYNTMFSTNLKFLVVQFLETRGITYQKAKVERDKTIDTLKAQLLAHLNNGLEPYFYKMVVKETNDALSIQLQYTELGALIMWGTEIPHDLSALRNDTLSMIYERTMGYTPKLRDMYVVNGKTVTYTENVASELCLTILNHKKIPRCVERHGKTELQIGGREVGHGLLPAIYNDTNVIITSDANNTGNVEFSQVEQDELFNITGKTAEFLNLDAGSAPTMVGFKEYTEYRGELGALPDIQTLNKPVDITIYSPTGVSMLTIKSQNLAEYTIVIYSNDGSQTIESKLPNLSIQNVIGIVNPVAPQFKFHASLLKSLGDLIPYQVVCMQSALQYGNQSTNVMGSIDYSMMFQLLGDVRFLKENADVTSDLNQTTILTGVNMENSNTYFPWSTHERNVYKLLYAIYGFDTDVSSQFVPIKNQITTVISEYVARNYNMITAVYEFLMSICIADLTTCAELIEKYPNSAALIDQLQPLIVELNTIQMTEEDLNGMIKDSQDDDQDDDQDDTSHRFTVNFDRTDYILAKLIARNIPITQPVSLNLPIQTSTATKRKAPLEGSKSSKKRKGGSNVKRTLRKRRR